MGEVYRARDGPGTRTVTRAEGEDRPGGGGSGVARQVGAREAFRETPAANREHGQQGVLEQRIPGRMLCSF